VCGKVVDDLSRIGRVWREADYEATDFETVVTDLLDGQYKNPVGIFGFNTAEGWARDVSADVAAERRLRFDGSWAPSREKQSMAHPSGIRRSKPQKPAGSRSAALPPQPARARANPI
jgi:hypothetical protein